jgi:hypothetical protein
LPIKRSIVRVAAVNSTLPTWMRYVVFVLTWKFTAEVWSPAPVSSLQATSDSAVMSVPVYTDTVVS